MRHPNAVPIDALFASPRARRDLLRPRFVARSLRIELEEESDGGYAPAIILHVGYALAVRGRARLRDDATVGQVVAALRRCAVRLVSQDDAGRELLAAPERPFADAYADLVAARGRLTAEVIPPRRKRRSRGAR